VDVVSLISDTVAVGASDNDWNTLPHPNGRLRVTKAVFFKPFVTELSGAGKWNKTSRFVDDLVSVFEEVIEYTSRAYFVTQPAVAPNTTSVTDAISWNVSELNVPVALLIPT